MALIDIITGNEVDIVVGHEASGFGTVSASIDQVLGLKQKWNYDINKNFERFHDLGLRTFLKAEEMKWEGAYDLDAVLANELFWPYVLGGGAGTGGDPYVFDAVGDVKSFSATVHDRGEGQFRNFLGCCVNDFSMSAAVGEPIMLKLSGPMASITAKAATDTRASLSIDGLDNPFSFKHAVVQISSTDNYWGLLQKFDLKLSQQAELYWNFGSRYAYQSKFHDAIGGIVMGVKHASNSTKQGMDAITDENAEGQNITIVITLTEATRSITMTLVGAYLNQLSTGYEVFSDVDQTLTFIFQTISVVLANF